MSGRYDPHEIANDQDWMGGAERAQAYREIQENRELGAVEAMCQVLMHAGIPFPRARELAERCFKAIDGAF